MGRGTWCSEAMHQAPRGDRSQDVRRVSRIALEKEGEAGTISHALMTTASEQRFDINARVLHARTEFPVSYKYTHKHTHAYTVHET